MKFRATMFTLMLLWCPVLKAKRLNTAQGERKSGYAKVSPEWEELLNPSKTKFWEDANGHLPDPGLLKVLKNPTKENARNWLIRNEIKTLRMKKAMALIDSENKRLIGGGAIVDHFGFNPKKTKRKTNKVNLKQIAGLKYYFLFKPECGHCKKLASKLTKLKNVIPLQMNKGKLHHWKGLSKSVFASKDTLSDYASEGVSPILIIQNPKTNKVAKLVGNQPIQEIYSRSMEVVK